ncbi:tRNA lysidine(34) synthetase TilS [Nocardioides campestrisoli]|uniref:tRNA lysidine(34) synthetase TilS n=1 Tax=Nocardioides campestrisoli TaxID=2736757 RepID=UPI00163DD413|nr:tRNA lysidine(34) synthetase TilS [Nocardioides campestrisoli]
MGGPDPAVAACRVAVRRALADLRAQQPGTLVVACSGGADSLALLAACVFEARARDADPGWRVVGATVDHGLQEGSAEQAQRVLAQMEALGVDETFSARVRVNAAGQGPEAAAREARYAVLGEIAARTQAAAVLLGHTLDDQAETVLLGLGRGSGGRSIAGMRRELVRDGTRYLRPLLDVRRGATEAACRAQGLDFWVDPHNSDPRFLRARVRHDVLPVLERELGPGVTETLARTADSLRADMEALDELTDAALAAPGALEVASLAALPVALRRRVLRAAAVRAGALDGELFAAHVLALDELVTRWRGQRWVDLPGHLRALRREGRIEFEHAVGPGSARG